MKKNLFILFFCASLGLFFTADSKGSVVAQEQGGSAYGCLYTETFGDVCSFLGYSVMFCKASPLTSCTIPYEVPSTP